MKKIEAIFFDVDGTLLNFGTNTVNTAVVQALRSLREKGLKIFIATGRHSSKLTFLEGLIDFDGFVTVNGQVCYNAKEDIYLEPISKEEVFLLANKMNELDIPCCFLKKHETLVNRMDERWQGYEEVLDLSDAKEEEFTEKDDFQVYQMVAHVTDEQEKLLLDLAQGVQTTRWNPEFVDIVPKGGNKSVGIERVLAYYGIPRENVMAFGDGSNDKEMLSYVGLGVAMGNAAPEIQQVADYVTDTVENDGVVKGLEHFGLL